MDINEHWEISFKDIDPDTGEISQDMPIALALKESHAKWICEALAQLGGIEYADPYREFYITHIPEQTV